jgi:peptide/nickel transport system ATP-binding protein
MLTVEDLSVRFDGERGPVQAVEDLSFAVEDGGALAIVGESGCGKSVTAMALLGLLGRRAQVSGRARLADVDLLGPKAQAVRGRRISIVFQEPMTSLNPVLTVGRQIGEVLRRHLGMSKGAARRRAVELLELVGIPAPDARVGEYPHQLSGGMRQRVMIAMAIACEPEVLIADEPTTALDVTIQAGVLDVMKDLRSRLGMAIVLITHDLGVVADIADRVVVMYAGRKVEEADVRELYADPRHPYTIGLLGAVPRVAGSGRLQEIPGIVPARTEPATSCVFAPRCERATEECLAGVPPLENRAACIHPGRMVAA